MLSKFKFGIRFFEKIFQNSIFNFDSESYIWWVIVDIVVPHSSEKLRNIWNEYVNKLIDVELGESKSSICASVVNELMGMYSVLNGVSI